MLSEQKKLAQIVDLLFIVGTLSGILSLVFAGDLFSNSTTFTSIQLNSNRITTGVLFVLIMTFSLSMVPVTLYPLLKKTNPRLALASVVFRGTLEAVTYILSALCWLMLVWIVNSEISNGLDTPIAFLYTKELLGILNTLCNTMVSIVFSIGTFFMYYCFYKNRLLPSWLSYWGIIGSVLYLMYPILFLYKFDFQLLMLPLAIQEMVMGVWLITKGFNKISIE